MKLLICTNCDGPVTLYTLHVCVCVCVRERGREAERECMCVEEGVLDWLIYTSYMSCSMTN